MKVGILVNHATAGTFYSQLFKSLGWDIYLPLKCSIEPIFVDDKVTAVRTIHDPILDNYDFYGNSENISPLVLEKLSEYDLILTYHVINRLLNIWLLNHKTVYIIWGRENDHHLDTFAYLHDFVLASKTAVFGISHSYILEDLPSHRKYVDLPLGLPSINYRWKGETSNKVLVVISRCWLKEWQNALKILGYLAERLPQFQFVICGKNNNFNHPRVSSLTFVDTDSLYEYMSSCRLGISFSFHRNILQYSTIEMATLGLPFIYEQGSAVARILGSRLAFSPEVNSVESMIDYAMEADHSFERELANTYQLETVREKWKTFLK